MYIEKKKLLRIKPQQLLLGYNMKTMNLLFMKGYQQYKFIITG